jgi:hypothetical protein
MRTEQMIRPYGMTHKKEYVKGIVEVANDRKAARPDLPQEPYDDLSYGREHDLL